MDERDLHNRKMNYLKVFNNPDGEKVLEDLKRHCFYNSPIYQGNINDALHSEGMRNVLLYILYQLETKN